MKDQSIIDLYLGPDGKTYNVDCWGNPVDANGNEIRFDDDRYSGRATPESGKNVPALREPTGDILAVSKGAKIMLPRHVVAYFNAQPGSSGAKGENLLARPSFINRGLEDVDIVTGIRTTITAWIKTKAKYYSLIPSTLHVTEVLSFYTADSIPSDFPAKPITAYQYLIYFDIAEYVRKAAKAYGVQRFPLVGKL